MRYRDSLPFWVIFLILTIILTTFSFVYTIIDPPPMTGTITNKNHHPAYFPATTQTPEVYVLAITNGNRCVSWVVDEKRWDLYEVGDEVGLLPRFLGEDT